MRESGAALSRFTERWIPDAWVICMALTAVALLLAIFGAGAGVEESVLAWGDGVWNLLTLAMQFTIAMVAAHACVSSRPVFRQLDRLAALLHPRTHVRTFTEEEIERILPSPPAEETPVRTPAGRIDSFRGWVWLAVALLAYLLGHSIVTQLGVWLESLFSRFATTGTYPFVVYVYSGFMNLFVSSAGSKWLIEAPFLIPARETLDVGAVTVLLAYAYGDSTTNLIRPFSRSRSSRSPECASATSSDTRSCWPSSASR